MPENSSATLYGIVPSALSIAELRSLLARCGLTPSTDDTHHVSVKECSYFVFRQTDRKEFLVSGDADTLEEMLTDARLVSGALSKSQVHHRFEVYDESDNLAAEFRYPEE